MEKSKYTIEIKKDGVLELINTLYGSVIELDEENQKIYRDILADKNLERYKEEIGILSEQGLIVESKEAEEAELREQYEQMKSSKDTLGLTLFTTTACNMQCVYCFEHLSPIFPDEKNIEDVMTFIETRYLKHPFKTLDVTWFGGEPLLNMAYIRKLSRKMISFADTHHVEYCADIITNGTLLTHDITCDLKNECHVSNMQISIDGLGPEHNKRRPLGNKDGFSIIMNNIINACNEIQIALRINVDKNNLFKVDELLKYLSEYGNIKDKVYIYFGKVIGDEPSCMTYSEFENERLSLNELLEKYGFHFTLSKLSLTGKLLPCSALSDNYFIIYPNGDLYKCYEVAGRKEYCIGTLTNLGEKYNNIIKEQFSIDTQCFDCNKYPLCRGDVCPYRYLESEMQCSHSDESIYRTIEIMKREMEKI